MTDPDHEAAEAMLREVLLGERRHDDDAFRAAVAASPELAARYAELRALQRDLEWSDADAASIAAAAAASAPRATAADRQTVAASFGAHAGAARPAPPARRRRWLLPLLAAAFVALLLLRRDAVPPPPPAPVPNGVLGERGDVTVERRAGRIVLRGLAELSGGQRYVLTLTADGRRFEPASFRTQPIELPDAWQHAIDDATSATLVIAEGDVVLPPLQLR